MFSPIPVHEPVLDPPPPDPIDRRPRIETIVISIILIVFLLFLLILMLILTSRFAEKKQPILPHISTMILPPLARNTTILTTITPSSIQATTLSVVSINNITTVCKKLYNYICCTELNFTKKSKSYSNMCY